MLIIFRSKKETIKLSSFFEERSMSRQIGSLVLFILFFLTPCLSCADTHNVPSPYDDSDVQKIINSASCVSGDIVYIPAGAVTWDTTVLIPDSKKITIQGGGMASTAITSNGTAIAMNASGSRLTGMEFILPEGASGNISVSAKGTGWRVDHCKFTNNTGGSRVGFGATASNSDILPSGLVDHCEFYQSRTGVQGWTYGSGALLKCSQEWAKASVIGTANAVYFEDNTFYKTLGDGGNITDANYAASYVARYNTITGSQCQVHSLQNDTSRGPRSWEIYENTFNAESAVWTPMFVRAGTGMIWGNTIDTDYNVDGVIFDNRRSYESFGIAGQCNGTSDWDGNTPGESGWPCRDQIGRGPDVSEWGGSGALPASTSSPAYLWLNRSGENIGIVSIHNNCENWIQSDRDYFNEVASFDGSTGVGTGTYAQMTALSPTKINAGFWCTDKGGNWNTSNEDVNDGCLYAWDGKSWEVEYTPYTYPHPLQNQMQPPIPPQNLKQSN
jgi:hypothetical protein